MCSGPLSPYRIVRFIRCLNPSDWAIGLCMCVVCVLVLCYSICLLDCVLSRYFIGIVIVCLCIFCVHICVRLLIVLLFTVLFVCDSKCGFAWLC